MGNKCYSSKRSNHLPNVEEQPLDTEQFNRQGLPPLDFELDLSNIEIRWLTPAVLAQCQFKSVCVQLVVDEGLERTLEQKPLAETMKWRDSCKAHIRLNEYQLRKRSLVLNVYSEMRLKVATLRLNLYQISVGPYHQDFQLNFPMNRLARISLDVKLSQLIELDIRPTQITIGMTIEHPGEQFHYTLRTVDESGVHIQSNPSYNAQIELFSSRARPNEKLQRNAETQNRIERRNSMKRKPSLVLACNQQLHWSVQEAKRLYQSSIPGLNTVINVGNMASYCLQLMLWKVKSQIANQDHTAFEEEVELYAECSANLSKLFLVEPKLTKVDEWTTVEDRFVDFTEKIWKEGKLLGTANLQCRVILPSFFKQMLVCVRTESGIQAIKPGFTFTSTQSSCPEVKRISEIKEEIEQSFMNLNMQQNSSGGKQRRISGLKYSIVEGLNQVTVLLHTVTADGKKCFKYRSQDDLQRAQMVMIDLGLKLLECLDDKDAAISEACYRTLIQLIGRESLALTYMKLNQQDQQRIMSTPNSSELPKHLREKLEIRLKYQSFLYRALRSGLHSLSKKALDEYQRVFSVLMAAQCFFRVPPFRRVYLEGLVAANSNPQFYKDMLHQLQGGTDPSLSMFLDWDSHFYQYLKHQPTNEQNRQLLMDTLESSDTKLVLSQRGSTFFCLIVEVVESIEAMFDGRGNINWPAVDGYPQLVGLFLCEMLSRPLERYPDKLREASVRLIANSELLPIFTRLLFKQTNVFANVQVFRSIELVEAYFDCLQRKGRICATFDYKFFYSAMKIVLESEHFNVISRCLVFLYKHYSSFSVAFRRELSLLLLGQYFFKLFLSWSKSVRQVFHSMLMYRINLDCNFTHRQKLPRFDEQQANEVAQKYHKALNIVRAAQRQLKKQNLQRATIGTLSYHKQLKQKLIDIRLRKKVRRDSNDHHRELLQKFALAALDNCPPLRSNSSFVVQTTVETTTINFQQYQQMAAGKEEKRRKISAALNLADLTDFEEQAKKKRIVSSTTSTDARLDENDLIARLPYLEVSLHEFAAIEDSLGKLLSPNFSHESAPVVSMKLTIDKAEIRPDDIDDWNG